MKEFIEKLIGRLEELRNDKYMNGVSRFTPNEKKVFDIAETIVNQLAEEYNNESVKGDLISRSELIKALNESGKQPLLDDDIEAYCDGWNDAVDIMNNQPTAYNDGWIPCSSGQFPEEYCNVLLTVNHFEEAQKGFLDHGVWYAEDSIKYAPGSVIAWQPLPAKYEQKAE